MLKQYKKYGSLLRHFLLDVYTVEGDFDGNTLRIIIADDGTTQDYITRLVFPDGATVSKIKKVCAFKGLDLVDSDADLVVVGVNNLLTDQYAQCGFRIIPKWLRLFLPVTEDPYARLSSFGRQTRSYFNRKIHKIEDAGFECEVVNGKSWFDLFYHKMYIPYTTKRFSDDAVIYKPSVIRKFYDRGHLVIAKKNGEPVAGIIVYDEDNMLHIPFGGIAGGDVELVKEGAMFALHYYLAQMAYSRGCAFIDFGRSRSFLDDGTLVYKLNWHMDAVPSAENRSSFAVSTPGSTPQAAKLLKLYPHFYIDGDKCRRSDE